jgi:hypothetical protein
MGRLQTVLIQERDNALLEWFGDPQNVSGTSKDPRKSILVC